MIRHASNTIPTERFDVWDDAIMWACAMRNQYGVKYTVRFVATHWVAYVPLIGTVQG